MKHRSTALPLAWAMAALIVYASLYPFAGWRWPVGMDAAALLRLPWPPWLDRFDAISNVLGYVPLGALIFGAVVRGGGRSAAALAWSVGLSALLSYSVEVGQQLLPVRVPSLKDCAFNVTGALAGALLAMAVWSAGWVERWHGLREHWFERDSATALLLLLLWPAALLFPAPAPLGLGHVGGELREWLLSAFADTPWSDEAMLWLSTGTAQTPLTRLQEGLITALGLLAPCLVAYTTSRPGLHRIALALGALAIGVLLMTASTALNFGPAHALAWWTGATLPALSAGTLLALALTGIGRRLAAALGLVTIVLLLALVAQAPSDPYFAASLHGWEQGRFVRFHGLAQWIGWAWPFAVLVWLLAQLSRAVQRH
jgi:VanZ family protein